MTGQGETPLERARKRLRRAAMAYASSPDVDTDAELQRGAILFAYEMGKAAGSAVGRLFSALTAPREDPK